MWRECPRLTENCRILFQSRFAATRYCLSCRRQAVIEKHRRFRERHGNYVVPPLRSKHVSLSR